MGGPSVGGGHDACARKLLLLCARGVEAEDEWKKIKSVYERLIGIDCY